MTFLIDGYNLMHAAGLATRAMPPAQFDRARERFLDWLADGIVGRGTTVRVVFDAQQAPSPSLESVHRGVRVRFAFRRTADDLIEELVAVEPKPAALTVVSNDSRVRESGRRAECLLATCEEFIDWLITPPTDGPPRGSPEADKPEPTPTDVDELHDVFSKPTPKL
ncbi:MAG: NYN domain-containing protein [Planctomycetes bacterium]|nr:NYN domain-containing protein [Planctomycetota bacterium]